MNLPSRAQAVAFGRHVVSFSMGVVAALAATHIATSDQAQSAATALTEIGQGVASIVTGASTLIAVASALWATVSASLKSQIASVQAHPEAQVTVTDPSLAAGIPGVKIVASK
jgi:spore maturation protein SpmB